MPLPGKQTLTGKQRRHLRGLGHHLSPTVQVGNAGVTEGVIAAAAAALDAHELIKVRIGENAPEAKDLVAAAISKGTDSETVQIIGRTLLFYRRHPEKPALRLPK